MSPQWASACEEASGAGSSFLQIAEAQLRTLQRQLRKLHSGDVALPRYDPRIHLTIVASRLRLTEEGRLALDEASRTLTSVIVALRRAEPKDLEGARSAALAAIAALEATLRSEASETA